MSANEVTIKIEGATTANRILRDLDFAVRRRIVSAAVRAGNAEIIKLARQFAPSRTGALSRQIRGSVKMERASGIISGRIRPKRTKGESKKGHKNAGRYAHIVILGAKPHAIPKPGQAREKRALSFTGRAFTRVEHPGFGPRPFMERAASAGFQHAVRAFTFKFDERLLIELAKIKAQNGG